MADILEEVLRDQSDEKKLNFFRRLLPITIIITIFVVIIMFINNWYVNKQTKINMKIGDILVKAINNEDKKLSLESLDTIIQHYQSNRAVEITALEQVSIKIHNNEKESALDLLDKIINNKEYYNITTAYARILWINLVIDKTNLSENEKEKLEIYLNYFNNEEQEFFGTASLLKALWYAKNAQNEIAGKILQKIIASENIPLTIKEQGRALLANLELSTRETK